MKGVIPSLGLWVLYIGLAAPLAHGQEPGKGGLSELDQYKELKKLKDGEKKLRQEEIRKECTKLRAMFDGAELVIYFKKTGNDAKESEIKGYLGRVEEVEEIFGDKFLRVHERGPDGNTIALIKCSAIVAILRK